MRKSIVFVALSGALMAAAPAAALELIVNGSFETGSYAGWGTFSWPGSAGALTVNPNGAPGPFSGLPINANASSGNWVSMTDQTGPGAYSLVQRFTIPVDATRVVVSFDHVATDWNGLGPFFNPSGLDPLQGPNQHARVDILVGSAEAFSSLADDLIANLYVGADPDIPAEWRSYAFDLTGILLPGQSYYFRAAEVDNLGYFNQGLDNVSVDVATGIPEPASWMMLIGGFGVVGFVLRGRGRVRFA